MFVNTKKAKEMLGVCSNTLRNWDRQGKIKTMRTPGGIRLYDVSSVVSATTRIIYARVSSRNQKDDLENQIAFLKKRYPNHELITDIGSGLNSYFRRNMLKRNGFNTLLERILSGDVAEIVVAHKDRLCRFGFELVESVAKKYNCRIVVLNESQLSPQGKLVQDILSIVHVFSCRLQDSYFRRNRLRKYSRKIKEDSDLPKKSSTNT